MEPVVYCIKNVVNGKVYVGSAVNKKIRWYNHKTALVNNRHHSRKLQRAWNKYGADNFEFQILETVQDKSNLLDREQYWIDSTKAATTLGYNCRPTAGSNIGYKASEETRQKMSKAHQGAQFSEEHRRKLSERMLGTVGNRKGHTTPPETRQKQRTAALGRKMPEAARARFDAMTAEERSLAAKKAWATKRAKAATQ